jgi:hypothetical protein
LTVRNNHAVVETTNTLHTEKQLYEHLEIDSRIEDVSFLIKTSKKAFLHTNSLEVGFISSDCRRSCFGIIGGFA